MALSFLFGCQTVPVSYQKYSEGQWTAVAKITDKKRNESHNVHLDIYAVKDSNVRVDASAAMGVGLASFVVNNDEMTFLLLRQKRFYEGPAVAAPMRAVLTIPLEPKLFYNVLFDTPIAEKSWSCTGAPGIAETCKKIDESLQIDWGRSQEGKKKIYITHNLANIEIIFKSFSSKVEGKEKIFSLKRPARFSRINFN